MPACCAFNCNYKHVNKTSGKTIHTFPFSRPLVLQKWIINVRRKNWNPTKRSVLCSDHFEEECFDRSLFRVRLKPNALPTRFNFPPHVEKKFHKRNGPSECFLEIESGFVENDSDFVENDSDFEETISTSNSVPQQQLSKDHPYNESHEKLKHQLEKEIVQTSLYQEKLRMKQQCIKNLEKTIHSMDELVDHFEQKPKRHKKFDAKNIDVPTFETEQQTSEDYTFNESPQKLKSKIEKEIEQNSFYKKKLKVKQQRIRRLSKKVQSMNELVGHLRPQTEVHTKVDTKLNLLMLTQKLGLKQWEGNEHVNPA